MTDPRITAAREFLWHARTRPKPAALPQIVIDREDAELRRQLGQVLDATGQAPALYDPGDDGTEPYCTTCGEWAGLFRGLAGWRHFRGDPAPGGERIVYDAGHAAVIGWCRPPGLALSPRGLITLGQAFGDAVAYWEREAHGKCDDCENSAAGLCDDHAAASGRIDAYVALGRQLGIEVSGS